jgi:hypothetical protein
VEPLRLGGTLLTLQAFRKGVSAADCFAFYLTIGLSSGYIFTIFSGFFSGFF